MRRGALLLALGCAGAVEVEAAPGAPPGRDSGIELVESADAGTPDAGCGLSFDEAVAANPGERVCQTIVYRLAAGYCTHWVACPEL